MLYISNWFIFSDKAYALHVQYIDILQIIIITARFRALLSLILWNLINLSVVADMAITHTTIASGI